MSHDTASRLARVYGRANPLERNRIARDSDIESRAIIREHMPERVRDDFDRRCLEQDGLDDEDSGWE